MTFGELDQGESRKAPRWRQRQWLQVGVAGFGFGNVMLLALPGYLGLDSLSGPWFKLLAGWLGLALALPVLVYSAADCWRAAWFSLKQRRLTLDVPIALGLAAIYGQSVFEVATGRGEGYCDSLTGLIFFLLCGRLFQRKTFDRLAFDRDYKGFFPLAVTRITERRSPNRLEADSEQAGSETGAPVEQSVSISQLAVGDRLLVRHGELVPADARLIAGNALVDYSFVTGESEPVTRNVGELLYAGGRQTGGVIEVETMKPVSESYLTSLWNDEAFRKHRDDDFDSQTNRYSRRFTLMVVGVAFAAAGLLSPLVCAVLMPLSSVTVVLFAIGTTRWVGRRTVGVGSSRREEALASIQPDPNDSSALSIAPGISPVMVDAVSAAASAASREVEAVETAPTRSSQNTGLKPGANERHPTDAGVPERRSQSVSESLIAEAIP